MCADSALQGTVMNLLTSSFLNNRAGSGSSGTSGGAGGFLAYQWCTYGPSCVIQPVIVMQGCTGQCTARRVFSDAA